MKTFKDVEGEFQHNRITHQHFWLGKYERSVFPFFSYKALLSVFCRQHSIGERTWALGYVSFNNIMNCLTLGKVFESQFPLITMA